MLIYRTEVCQFTEWKYANSPNAIDFRAQSVLKRGWQRAGRRHGVVISQCLAQDIRGRGFRGMVSGAEIEDCDSHVAHPVFFGSVHCDCGAWHRPGGCFAVRALRSPDPTPSARAHTRSAASHHSTTLHMSIEVFGYATASHKSAEGRSKHYEWSQLIVVEKREAVKRNPNHRSFTHALPLKTPKSHDWGLFDIISAWLEGRYMSLRL